MKRIVLWGLVALVATGVAFATGTSEPAAAGGKPLPMKYVCPGSDYPDAPNALAAVNKKLQKDGVNIEVQVQYVGWDAWWNKTNVMLSSGEPFDLMHIMENGNITTSGYVGKGALTQTDDLIAKYGQKMKPMFADWMWNACKVNGKQYSIPAFWRDTTQQGGEVGEITYRKDVFDAMGIAVPKTPQDLIAVANQIQKARGSDVYIWEHMATRSPIWLHRTYASWPFYVDIENPIITIDKKGTVSSWYESEEFKNDCAFYRSVYTMGLINPDVLSLQRDQIQTQYDNGKFSFGLGTGSVGNVVALRNHGLKDAVISHFFFNPEKPVLLGLPVLNSNGVPITSKNPQTAIQFLNWLYTSKENHDLFLYGIVGQDYTPIGENRMDTVRDANARPIYAHDWWQIAYYKWARFDKNAPDEDVRLCTTTNPNVVTGFNVGFAFDTSPVASELANVQAEIKASMLPIRWGVVDFDQYYPDAIKKMKAAGLDKVVAEYKKQFDAFRAGLK